MLEVKDRQETRVKKAHIALMKHPETALYSGVMLMGESAVVDGSFTAYTDGVNKKYCKQYIAEYKSEAKLRGLILHENLHVALKQIQRGKDMFKEDRKVANMAADFVVNDIIFCIEGKVSGSSERIVELPDGALHDVFFRNWSMREVYNHIRKENPQRQKPTKGGSEECDEQGDSQGDGSQPSDSQGGENKIKANGKEYDMSGDGFDEHDISGKELTAEEAKELNDKIDKALREGGILAGRMGAKLPRSIADMLAPKIDWREELREFITSSVRGKDEFTWRRMNRRQLANDMYLPSVENETIGEVVVAIDTSGSIGTKELTEFASELVSICEIAQPEKVRVLWWDTQVHGEQVFEQDEYQNIASLLKPLGGGGTYVSCVGEHINKEKINAECVVVFTDGYVEHDIVWNIQAPTLWMITMNRDLTVPTGKKVIYNKD
jgi:predicted metal-dependent peptidase